jgi:hypothetical protein
MARQREGDIATFHFIDNLSRAIRHTGRILVDLIPKVYDQPRVMRLMGEDGTPHVAQVNAPQPDGSRLLDLTVGKYDLTVNSGPSFTSRREEAATQMTELLRSFPDAAPFIGDILAKNLDWPGADEIAKRLKAMLPPQIQAMEQEDQKDIPPEVQAMIAQGKQQIEQMQQQLQQGMQMFKQLQGELAQAKQAVQDKQSELMIKREDAQLKHESEIIKAQAEVRIAEIEAEAAKQVATIEATVQALQAKLDGMVQAMQAQPQQQAQPIYIGGGRKTIQVQAPSGNVYTGVIEDEGGDESQVG